MPHAYGSDSPCCSTGCDGSEERMAPRSGGTAGCDGSIPATARSSQQRFDVHLRRLRSSRAAHPSFSRASPNATREGRSRRVGLE